MEALGIVFLVAVVGTMGYVAWLRQRQMSASAATMRELQAASERASESLVLAGQALAKLDETLQAGMARLGEQPSAREELFLVGESRRAGELLRRWLQARSAAGSAMQGRLFVCRADLLSATHQLLSAHGGLQTSAVEECSRDFGLAFDFSASVPGRERATYNVAPFATPSSKMVQESCWQEWAEYVARPIPRKQAKLGYAPHAGLFSCGVGAH